jgi:phosphoglycerol transferase MdoB-like AlkP superfamily enzyme
LPQELSEKFPKGELAIHQSIGYSDYALKKFFEEAQSMKWFDNTLFVITADHTSPLSIKTKYKNKIGRYSIPIMFWKSDQSLSGKINTISQQIDIFPTILDILNYDKDFFSFGKSIFENKNWAISFLKNEYLFINEENILINKNENYTFYQDNNLSIKTNANDSVIIKLKSIKQEFNSRMIKNKMNNVDN